MDYGRLLRRSLEIVRDHRYLWLLALFAGEGSSSLGANLRLPSSTGNFGGGRHPAGAPPAPPDAAAVQAWLTAHGGLLAAGLGALVLLWIVLFLVSCVAAAAVIRGAAAIEGGTPVGLGGAWRLGWERAGGVLRLRLLLLLAGLLVGLLFAALVAAGVAAAIGHTWLALGLAIWFGLGLAVLLLPVLIVLPTVLRLALRAIVLDGRGAVEGVRAALRLARRRLGPVVVLFAIELATGLVVAIVVLLVVAVAAIPGIEIGIASGLSSGALAGLVGLAVVLALALIVVGAAVAAFLSTLWTLGYRELSAA